MQHCPALDGEALQNALSKFIEQPYQGIVRKPNDVIYMDDELASKVFEIEVVTFAIWRAAVALRHSKALEVSEIKHGSNWLIQPAEEPYLVKFVLEDQGYNYIVINALPDLEPSVTITDSGWLPTINSDTSSTTTITQFVDTAQKKGLVALAHQGPRLPMSGFKFSEDLAEGLGDIHERMLESRSASKALLGEEQESFLAEAALRGQTAARIPVEESPSPLYFYFIPSEEYHKLCEENKASEAESRAGSTANHYMTPVGVVEQLSKRIS